MDVFKKINIGSLIQNKVQEDNVDIFRICNFFNLEKGKIEKMYMAEDLSTFFLLKWSKLLEYDFFRIYSQHLILYSPPAGANPLHKNGSKLPQFRKKIYTKQVIDFILEKIDKGEKTQKEIMEIYGIPKTTLHTWIKKYGEDYKNE
ncbi:helix-turn-helix domain-containing protein [Chryseobacterium sp. MIQD13]|uniref:helix-turn-helix domain-containing protein n=1 Tax=Chryseobacterium sp. MIQD13 TaxID=3422310 RepID=UPI003D27E385